MASTTTTLKKLTNGLRAGGIRWLARTIRNEFYNPRRTITFHCRRAIGLAVAFVDAVRRATGIAPAREGAAYDDTLVFCFDLEAAPVTFDLASHLAGAEVTRRRLGLRDIYVAVVPGTQSGFRIEAPEYNSIVDIASRRWRLLNMVLPLPFLLSSVSGVRLCRDRAEAASLVRNARHVFPEGYLPLLPRQPAGRVVRDAARAGEPIWPLFRAGPKALDYAREMLERHGGGNRTVLISLRQHDHMPTRNSNLAVWRDFAATLKESGFLPIFLIDMESDAAGHFAGLEDQIVLEGAFWNLPLRMALYELAWLNMGIMHGPMELCWYNEMCRYVVFIPVDAAPQCSTETLLEQGHEIGRNFRFARPYQRLVWEADSAAAVRREFAAMRAILERLDTATK